MKLRYSICTDDPVALIQLAIRTELAPADKPDEIHVANKPWPITPDWLSTAYQAAISLGQRIVMAYLGKSDFIQIDTKWKVAKWEHDATPASTRALFDPFMHLPMTLGVCRVAYDSWRTAKYQHVGFGERHFSHGFACFFQGDGHQRLVSRRWLDYGPWRLLRGENDTTMVQFHDLEADGETALAQAIPGHERMGMSYTGGFLWPTMTLRILKSWLYDRASRKVTVLINRRAIEQGELLEAATMRAFQTLGPDQPIERVAYVFVHPDEAQQHLHELWLRELECWTFTPKGQEIRLDLDYQPPPPMKPDWVQQVEAREAE